MSYIISTLLGTIPYLPFKPINHPIEVFLEDFPMHLIKKGQLSHILPHSTVTHLSTKHPTLIQTKQGHIKMTAHQLNAIALDNHFKTARIAVPNDIHEFVALMGQGRTDVCVRFVNELERRIVVDGDDRNYNTLVRVNEDYVDWLRESGDMLYMSVVVEHNMGVVERLVGMVDELRDGEIDVTYK
ncbi:hypothetical protein THOM_2908 [Trachipleistophora hominis]|uniref:Uncharacterized protein n=1 Tax=Trachipleistophora hominis TaxID=72359 RepID=L7JSB8_TRAHO|nr:hypothetical protein THOM_2908 [Trachipleistophora hominis]